MESDELRRALHLNAFKRFLRTFAPTENVGVAVSACHCPVATHLRRWFKGRDITVTSGCIQVGGVEVIAPRWGSDCLSARSTLAMVQEAALNNAPS